MNHYISYYQFPSNEVMTPFSYRDYDSLTDNSLPKQRTNVDSISSRTANYTDYDLFCFGSKLTEQIRRLNPNLSHRLVPKKYKKRIFWFVHLQAGALNLPIDKDLQSKLQDAVTEAYRTLPGKALFFSAHFDLLIHGLTLPRLWLKSVLPLVSVPEYINYHSLAIHNLETEVQDDCLYLRLHADTNYSTDYNALKLDFLNHLLYLYRCGTVALSPDSPLIAKWQLVERTSGLYTSKWYNCLFAQDKTLFFLRLLLGSQTISIRIGENQVLRHHIAEKLKLAHFFTQDSLVVFVQNLTQALQASFVVSKAWRYTEGAVALSKQETEKTVSYKTTEKGLVYSQLQEY